MRVGSHLRLAPKKQGCNGTPHLGEAQHVILGVTGAHAERMQLKEPAEPVRPVYSARPPDSERPEDRHLR